MAYIPLEDIKKKIVRYLEESIESQTFDFKNLSFTYINKNIKENIDRKKLEKAVDGLIDDGEIKKYKSNLEIYVPTGSEKQKNLMPLKLGDPFLTIMYTYIYGLFAIILMIMLIPGFQRFILSFDFSKPANVIGNSVALGALFPYGVGYILNIIFNVIGKKVSSIGINRGGLATIIFFPAIFLLIYIGISSYFQKSIEPYLIILVLGLGLTFGYYFYKMALKKSSEDIKFNNKDSD